MRSLLRRLRNRIRYRRFDADLAEEIEFHRAMKQREWEREGLTATEARLMSHRDMGNMTLARECSREVWIASWFDGFRQDLRYAFRSLSGRPGFTIAACTALVLGIGVNTTLFTGFNAVALRPWAVPNPQSVVTAQYVHSSASGQGTSGFGIAEYRYLRDHARTFSGLIAWRRGAARLGHEDIDRQTLFAFVSGNYFDVLGLRLQHGRSFLPEVARRDVTRTGRRLRSALLAAQLALSVILLASASLLVRGVQQAQTRDPGFRIDGVFAASLVFPARAYDQKRAAAFVSALYTALKADLLNGSVALTNTIPLGNARNLTSFRLPGEDEKQSRMIQVESVSPEYFEVLNIRVLAGRHLDAMDRPGGAITINEAMARRYWPGANPVGRTIVFGSRQRQIVGIVRNAHTTGLESVEPVYYELTAGGPSTRLLVRSRTADPTPRVQAIASALDNRVAVLARPLSTYRDESLEPSRVMALIAGVVGLLALLLASVGVFGVFSYVVHERTREIGIRMAIGARTPQVVRLVLRSSAWATLGGLAGGLLGSFVVSQFLTGQLFGLSRLDPTAYAMVGTVLTLAAALATWLPARRATRIDPATALRVE